MFEPHHLAHLLDKPRLVPRPGRLAREPPPALGPGACFPGASWTKLLPGPDWPPILRDMAGDYKSGSFQNKRTKEK
jgi:hypothetical protein